MLATVVVGGAEILGNQPPNRRSASLVCHTIPKVGVVPHPFGLGRIDLWYVESRRDVRIPLFEHRRRTERRVCVVVQHHHETLGVDGFGERLVHLGLELSMRRRVTRSVRRGFAVPRVVRLSRQLVFLRRSQVLERFVL